MLLTQQLHCKQCEMISVISRYRSEEMKCVIISIPLELKRLNTARGRDGEHPSYSINI